MPLARIITQSQAYARELAIDLLARGYTVEIVSPDKVPDNMADLELRLDAAPGDQLIASVEVNNGKGKTSLDFVHHLKAPMADFKRRPMAAEPGLSDSDTAAVLTPVVRTQQPVPKPLSASAKIVLRPEPKSGVEEVEEGEEKERRTTPPDNLPTVAVDVPMTAKISAAIQSAQATSLTAHRERYRLPDFVRYLPLSIPNLKIDSWRAPVALVTAALLVATLWFGFRQTGKASAHAPAAAPAEILATSPAKDIMGNSDAAPQVASQAANALPIETTKSTSAVTSTTPKPRAHYSDDFVARDTVIYLDKHFAEQASAKTNRAKQSAKRAASSAQIRDGVIAANSVTYLNGKQAPKTAAPKPQPNSN